MMFLTYEVMRFLLRLCLISELEIVLDEYKLIFLRKVEARQARKREGKDIESD